MDHRVKKLVIKKTIKEARDKGYRTVTMKFRRILNCGFFVDFPLLTSIEVDNESHIRLWRSVIDQHLKDIISHHLIQRNYHQYYDARKFIDDQISGEGSECDLAYLDADRTKGIYVSIERMCRILREKEITL